MSLQAFQHALSELVATPALCLAVRAGDAGFFERFDLSEMEKVRLSKVVWQPGMSVSCSMYRSNRITPIYTLLNFTCKLLGDGLKSELEHYWSSIELADLQFREEIDRFGNFLRHRIVTAGITNPYVEEVLDFELTLNELQFIPRRKLLQQLSDLPPSQERGPFQLNPLMRIVRFRHEPFKLLEALGRKRTPPQDLPTGEFLVVLSAIEEQTDMKLLNTRVGNMLLRIQTAEVSQQYSSELMELVREGFLVPQ